MASSRRAKHLTRLLFSEGAASVTLYMNVFFLHNSVGSRRDSEWKLMLQSCASYRVVCIFDFFRKTRDLWPS